MTELVLCAGFNPDIFFRCAESRDWPFIREWSAGIVPSLTEDAGAPPELDVQSSELAKKSSSQLHGASKLHIALAQHSCASSLHVRHAGSQGPQDHRRAARRCRLGRPGPRGDEPPRRHGVAVREYPARFRPVRLPPARRRQSLRRDRGQGGRQHAVGRRRAGERLPRRDRPRRLPPGESRCASTTRRPRPRSSSRTAPTRSERSRRVFGFHRPETLLGWLEAELVSAGAAGRLAAARHGGPAGLPGRGHRRHRGLAEAGRPARLRADGDRRRQDLHGRDAQLPPAGPRRRAPHPVPGRPQQPRAPDAQGVPGLPPARHRAAVHRDSTTCSGSGQPASIHPRRW